MVFSIVKNPTVINLVGGWDLTETVFAVDHLRDVQCTKIGDTLQIHVRVCQAVAALFLKPAKDTGVIINVHQALPDTVIESPCVRTVSTKTVMDQKVVTDPLV